MAKSAGVNGGNGEQWEHDNYNKLSKEIWLLVPKEKQNKLESKIAKSLETTKMKIYVVLGIGIVVIIVAVFISKKKEKKSNSKGEI